MASVRDEAKYFSVDDIKMVDDNIEIKIKHVDNPELDKVEKLSIQDLKLESGDALNKNVQEYQMGKKMKKANKAMSLYGSVMGLKGGLDSIDSGDVEHAVQGIGGFAYDLKGLTDTKLGHRLSKGLKNKKLGQKLTAAVTSLMSKITTPAMKTGGKLMSASIKGIAATSGKLIGRFAKKIPASVNLK